MQLEKIAQQMRSLKDIPTSILVLMTVEIVVLLSYAPALVLHVQEDLATSMYIKEVVLTREKIVGTSIGSGTEVTA